MAAKREIERELGRDRILSFPPINPLLDDRGTLYVTVAPHVFLVLEVLGMIVGGAAL